MRWLPPIRYRSTTAASQVEQRCINRSQAWCSSEPRQASKTTLHGGVGTAAVVCSTRTPASDFGLSCSRTGVSRLLERRLQSVVGTSILLVVGVNGIHAVCRETTAQQSRGEHRILPRHYYSMSQRRLSDGRNLAAGKNWEPQVNTSSACCETALEAAARGGTHEPSIAVEVTGSRSRHAMGGMYTVAIPSSHAALEATALCNRHKSSCSWR